MRNFLLLILAVTTPAITSGETLRGSAKDSLDASISGALVLVHWDPAGSTVGLTSNIGIKADLSIRTKNDGTFSIDLPPGFYDVFVAATAFSPTCRKIRMQVGKGQEITLHLNVDPLYLAEMGDRFDVPPPKH
jgi:hypothetical protein